MRYSICSVAELTSEDKAERVLCPDEACIGVLGEDGKCPECGAIGDVDAVASEPASGELEAGDDDLSAAGDDDSSEAGDDDSSEAGDGDPPEAGDDDLSEGFEADRELCPDGACIGVIGGDGRCKICHKPGRSAALDPRQRAKLTDDELEDMGRSELAQRSPDSGGDDFDDRELCIDDGCIGLVDSDGRCKECGKEARAAS